MLQQTLLTAMALVGLYGVGFALINQLQKVLTPMSDALNRLTTSVGGLIDANTGLTAQVELNDTELKAVADALRGGTANNDDAALNALADRLDTARDATNAEATNAKAAAADAATALPPSTVQATVTFTPTSLTGTVGSGPVEGTFEGAGGQEPYTFAGNSADVAAFLVNEDGTFTLGTDTSASGSAQVQATDANGIQSAMTDVTISVS